MKVKAGERIKVVKGRKSPLPYFAKATEDFDTETDDWWPMVLDQDHPVHGINHDWRKGAELPERKGITEIEKV